MPTERQQQVLMVIEAFIDDHGYPPTTRELADKLGVRVSAAHNFLLRLRDEGLIDWDDNRARTLRIL